MIFSDFFFTGRREAKIESIYLELLARKEILNVLSNLKQSTILWFPAQISESALSFYKYKSDKKHFLKASQ